MGYIILLIVGVLIGVFLAGFIFRANSSGELRIDCSDPADGPYFFLVLDRESVQSIHKRKVVTLTVNSKDFISQK